MSERKKDFALGFVPLSLIVRSNETILPSQTKLRLLQHLGGRILRASLRAWRRRRRLLRKANLLSSDLLPRRFARITDRCCYARRECNLRQTPRKDVPADVVSVAISARKLPDYGIWAWSQIIFCRHTQEYT